MALTDTLRTREGAEHSMAGLLPGRVCMRERLTAIGLHELALAAGVLRGHSFHYSDFDTPLSAWRQTQPHGGGASEPVYRRGALTASYMHGYFPSCPESAAAFFREAA